MKMCTFVVQRNPACLGVWESHGFAGGRLVSNSLIQQYSNKYKIPLRPFRHKHFRGTENILAPFISTEISNFAILPESVSVFNYGYR